MNKTRHFYFKIKTFLWEKHSPRHWTPCSFRITRFLIKGYSTDTENSTLNVTPRGYGEEAS